MGIREPANAAEAQAIVSENLELDADTFGEAEGDEEFQGPDDVEGEEGDGEEDTNEGDIDGNERAPAVEEPGGAAALDALMLKPERTEEALNKREARFDRKGNIVDTKTGKVIAPAGPAARFYQDAFKARQESVIHRQRADDYAQRLNKAVEIGDEAFRQLDEAKKAGTNATARQLGLTDPETIDAMQLAAEAKRDPVATLQKLLTRAAANGTDLTKLGLTAGGFNPQALMEMVRTEIGKVAQPITDAQKAEQARVQAEGQRTAVLQRTEAAARSYFEGRPDHVRYMPIYLKVLENPQYAGMSLGEIGARIEMNLLRQRYEGRGRTGANGANPQKRSLPNGRAAASGQEAGESDNTLAPVSMSYDAILKPLVAKHYRQ